MRLRTVDYTWPNSGDWEWVLDKVRFQKRLSFIKSFVHDLLLEKPLTEDLVTELVQVNALNEVILLHEEDYTWVRNAGNRSSSLGITCWHLFNPDNFILSHNADMNLLKSCNVMISSSSDSSECPLELLGCKGIE